MENNENHRQLKIDEIHKGMTVAICRRAAYGNYYGAFSGSSGYTHKSIKKWDLHTVARVTPKKTKIVFDDGGYEIKAVDGIPRISLFAPDDLMQKENKDAERFISAHRLMEAVSEKSLRGTLCSMSGDELQVLTDELEKVIAMLKGKKAT